MADFLPPLLRSMAEHPWIRVRVEDDGPMDLGGEYWHCETCGVGAGPAHSPEMEKRLLEKIGRIRWRPFVPGHGVRVSEDCEEAQKQIREFAEKQIGIIRERWKNPRGEHSHYASLLHDALRWTPEKTNITPVLELIHWIDWPGPMHDHKRPSLMQVRDELEKAGFCVMPPALAEAVRELGEDRYQRMRRGEPLEDDE